MINSTSCTGDLGSLRRPTRLQNPFFIREHVNLLRTFPFQGNYINVLSGKTSLAPAINFNLWLNFQQWSRFVKNVQFNHEKSSYTQRIDSWGGDLMCWLWCRFQGCSEFDSHIAETRSLLRVNRIPEVNKSGSIVQPAEHHPPPVRFRGFMSAALCRLWLTDWLTVFYIFLGFVELIVSCLNNVWVTAIKV